ncbi:MAG: MGMT family protein [Actinomycetota bacterium]
MVDTRRTRKVGVTLFDTAIGRVGIAWRPSVITAIQLPEPDDAATLRRLRATLSTAPTGVDGGNGPAVGAEARPDFVNDAIALITDLLAGRQADLDTIALDLARVPDFDRAVYDIARAIPPGESMTYGEVAQQIGDKGAARAVGRSLGANPFAIVVPCHRVLGAKGALTGFSANGGVDTKRKMLLIEGCPAVPPSLFD